MTAILIVVIDYFMQGIEVKGVITPIILTVVLGVLNFTVKPILSILALPITFMTLGLFSLVINGIIVWIATILVPEFVVHGILAGLIFSVVLSLSQSLVFSISGSK